MSRRSLKLLALIVSPSELIHRKPALERVNLVSHDLGDCSLQELVPPMIRSCVLPCLRSEHILMTRSCLSRQLPVQPRRSLIGFFVNSVSLALIRQLLGCHRMTAFALSNAFVEIVKRES